jgi:threonine dehydratase
MTNAVTRLFPVLNRELVQDARAVLESVVSQTPLLESPGLNRRLGGRLLVKAECLQRTGSFKFRAAYFRLSVLKREQPGCRAVAYSSGNFGIGLAAAGAELGVDVTIVAPCDAPEAKLARIREWGASLVLVDPGNANRELVASDRATRIARDSGAALLHPFDDPLLLAAHAALAEEGIRQAVMVAGTVDLLVVPCGGGGLAAACCWAARQLAPQCQVHAVEPVDAASLALSLENRRRTRLQGVGSSVCDALCAPIPGELAFEILQRDLHCVHRVGDEAVLQAVALGVRELKVALEPSAAITLAAVCEGRPNVCGRVAVIIATGGNFDLSLMHR